VDIPDAQLEQIRANAEAGHPESQFLLSQICQQNGDTSGMIRWLRKASASGVPDAITALGHCYEQGVGFERNIPAALEHYDEALARHSVAATYRKAELLYKSRQGAEEQEQIRDLLGSAATAGFEPAIRAISYLAAQSGRPGDGLSPSVALYPASGILPRHEHNSDPDIAVFNKVLDPDDCAYLVALSRPFLRHSDVIDPDSQQDGMRSDVRTSSGTFLPVEVVDIVARYIELKIVQAVGEDLDRSEPMSILRYEPGEYYRPHYDYFTPDLKVSAGLMEDGGQRVASAVTYLSVPAEGGGTSFPQLGIAVPPELGATLWFRNCDEDGQPDPRSLHAGDTVTQGEKWVVTKWFREEATQYANF
jgi:prolyl 4-hydroxylase